ncbi:MAG TPA: putative toxin-antitoxin system toxin component, PIN family [Candidatus Sulfotelmatobacter sp.]
MRCVVDTNVFVSAAVFSPSVPRRAVSKALRGDLLLFSEYSMDELKEVLLRPKFDRYISLADRKVFIQQLTDMAEFVSIIQFVRECRDPKDDKFLEVALNGRADMIITGDADLLAMHPWRGIAILTPSSYLER